jgi:hypothetical protein
LARLYVLWTIAVAHFPDVLDAAREFISGSMWHAVSGAAAGCMEDGAATRMTNGIQWPPTARKDRQLHPVHLSVN